MKNSVSDMLAYVVGKLAQEMGEDWRLEHAELMDAYQAYQDDQFVVDRVSQELLKVYTSATNYDFDTETFKIRCSNCQEIVETTLKKILDVIKQQRESVLLTIRSQYHFSVPWIGTDFTVTLWKRSLELTQPKNFLR